MPIMSSGFFGDVYFLEAMTFLEITKNIHRSGTLRDGFLRNTKLLAANADFLEGAGFFEATLFATGFFATIFCDDAGFFECAAVSEESRTSQKSQGSRQKNAQKKKARVFPMMRDSSKTRFLRRCGIS